MIFQIFSPKYLAEKMAFLPKLMLVRTNIWIMTLVFKKKANFFSENRQKSLKIVKYIDPRLGENSPFGRKFVVLGAL
jgi:hypothetical protein